MNLKITALSVACALALAACGNESAPADQTEATTAAAPADTAAAAAADPTPAAATPTDVKPAAVVTDCSTTIEGNDAMQYDVGSITVPTSCSEFTINLKHAGQLPVTAMGHNVVIALAADREAIASDGATAGVDANYVKPDDARVIASTKMIGGGETTSITFPVSRLQAGGPYEFFCSFPGHWTIMRGTIQVG